MKGGDAGNGAHFTVPKCTKWVVANARRFEGVKLDVKGETDEELASFLGVDMLRTGLTTRAWPSSCPPAGSTTRPDQVDTVVGGGRETPFAPESS